MTKLFDELKEGLERSLDYAKGKCSKKVRVQVVLMTHALESGRTLGAITAWAETSNWDFRGVEAYQRLGFALCSFDLSLHSRTPSEGEFALFLSSQEMPIRQNTLDEFMMTTSPFSAR